MSSRTVSWIIVGPTAIFTFIKCARGEWEVALWAALTAYWAFLAGESRTTWSSRSRTATDGLSARCISQVRDHPPKPTSPKSAPRSFRIPADDESFNEDWALACNIIGITSEQKYPDWKFERVFINGVNANPEKWAGAFTRGELVL